MKSVDLNECDASGQSGDSGESGDPSEYGNQKICGFYGAIKLRKGQAESVLGGWVRWVMVGDG